MHWHYTKYGVIISHRTKMEVISIFGELIQQPYICQIGRST
jgi:hypothetical protein